MSHHLLLFLLSPISSKCTGIKTQASHFFSIWWGNLYSILLFNELIFSVPLSLEQSGEWNHIDYPSDNDRVHVSHKKHLAIYISYCSLQRETPIHLHKNVHGKVFFKSYHFNALSTLAFINHFYNTNVALAYRLKQNCERGLTSRNQCPWPYDLNSIAISPLWGTGNITEEGIERV